MILVVSVVRVLSSGGDETPRARRPMGRDVEAGAALCALSGGGSSRDGLINDEIGLKQLQVSGSARDRCRRRVC